MASFFQVAVHESQSPERVAFDLRESLRMRQVNHKFHYDTYKQTQKWLALHEAFSPARTDANCRLTYDRSFSAAVERLSAKRIHLIGLGCGGGQKDARLLDLLQEREREVSYTPVDVGVAMVLMASQAASEVLQRRKPSLEAAEPIGLVCDLLTAEGLGEWFDRQIPADFARLITFFGMIPNFEPQIILPRLAALLRPADSLLFSANLAPGKDYAAGVRRILPLYDNALTEDWLLTFLRDLGLKPGDGALEWSVEAGEQNLLRVTAFFRFTHRCALRVMGEEFSFKAGEKLRLFFSYRYTPARVRELLHEHGLMVEDEWITDSEEEGIFLCRREV